MRVRTVSAALLLALSVAACSDEPREPSALPTLDQSQSPRVSLEPKPSATGINAATPQGAAAFARHFYDQVELAYEQRDPDLIQRLSAPGCVACERFIASVSRLRNNNERSEGLIYNISFAEAPAIEGDEARVDVIYSGPEVVRYDAAGEVINREPAAENAEEQVNLVRSGEAWLVSEILRT